MAKMFYSVQEAAAKLGKTEDELKGLVREGQLREFRDGDSFNYKVEDVDSLVESVSASAPASAPAIDESEAVDASPSDIVLEPVEDSAVELAALGGSDVISLDESAAGETATGTTTAGKAKEDTVVPSVGVNVFDDEELDEQVDPLAQTAVTDVAGLGIDGAGSGSGILDLTRESDDTSLGRELLDEIYTDESTDEASGEEAKEMGADTRAGLDEVIPDETVLAEEDGESEAEPIAAGADTRVVVKQVIEYAPDALSASLTALLVVAVGVMGIAGLGVASLVRGVQPALLEAVYANLWVYAAGAAGVAIIAAAVTYIVGKRAG